jgi:hypothetical protein
MPMSGLLKCNLAGPRNVQLDMKQLWLVGACIALATATSACVNSHSPTPTSRHVVSSFSTSHAVAAGSVLVSLAGWATVRIPRQWRVTPFKGAPAPVYFPLDFVSTEQLPAACPGHISSSCAGQNWFAPGWTTPDGGVLILWAHAEFPSGPALAHVSGRRTTIDQRPAKVRSGPATGMCPPGTVAEIDAYISASGLTGERFDMRACFGRHSTSNDHTAVLAMFNSIHRKFRT